MHLHDKSFNLPRHKIEKFENLCQQIFHINNFEQLCQFFWGGEKGGGGRDWSTSWESMDYPVIRVALGENRYRLYTQNGARQPIRVYPYVYIMFNDELTIAMVMVIRYYGNDPFHGNSSTRWKEDVEPVVTWTAEGGEARLGRVSNTFNFVVMVTK